MAKTYNTLKKMNRPIRFFGLSSLQLGAICIVGAIIIIILILQNANPLLIATAIILVLIILSFLFGKLNKEHKKGNPNYLSGLSVKSSTPKKIVDKSLIFKNLIK